VKKMKRLFIITGLAAALLLTVSLTAFADTWTGWISDSGCGAKGVAASHKDCAVKCVTGKGAKWVFVNSADKKVYAIHNQDAVSESNVGMEVKVTGSITENAIHVDSIAAAGGM
jgi:hypothetical protein